MVRGTATAEERGFEGACKDKAPAREASHGRMDRVATRCSGKDELVKESFFLEILQPPVALRQRNKRRPF